MGLHVGTIAPSGDLKIAVKRNLRVSRTETPARELSMGEILKYAGPSPELSEEVNRWRRSNLPNVLRRAHKVMVARKLGIHHVYGQLSIVVCRKNGELVDLGLASMGVVTTAGVNYLVDCLQNLAEPELLKFHGLGTNATAEAIGDVALGTELTTQYNPDNTRATGSLTEGASANIFRTVGTITVDAAAAVTEHGVLTQAATGGGTLLDRSVFSVVNLGIGDSFQGTYDFTITAGS